MWGQLRDRRARELRIWQVSVEGGVMAISVRKRTKEKVMEWKKLGGSKPWGFSEVETWF